MLTTNKWIVAYLVCFLTLDVLGLPLKDANCQSTFKQLHTGLSWYKLVCPLLYGQKQFINILEVDLTNPTLTVRPFKTLNNQLAPLTHIARQNTDIIAGINGGYFYNGQQTSYQDPICPEKTYPQLADLGNSLLQIKGKLIATNCMVKRGESWLARSVFAIDENNHAYIQLVMPNQSLKNLYHPSNEHNVAYALGGGPNLISNGGDNGGFINITDEGFPWHHVKSGRTAVGLTKDKHLFMITVDGKTHVSGMTIPELADFMLNRLNVSAAMNFDGGGSTSMCIRSKVSENCEVVNQPSDASGARKIHDGLFVILANRHPA